MLRDEETTLCIALGSEGLHIERGIIKLTSGPPLPRNWEVPCAEYGKERNEGLNRPDAEPEDAPKKTKNGECYNV